MQRQVEVCALTGVALGTAYVLWRQYHTQYHTHSNSGNDGKGEFTFDAPLPAHILLPDEDVQTGVGVELGDAYRRDKMRHLVISSAVSPAHLKSLLPIIKELFVPQKVR